MLSTPQRSNDESERINSLITLLNRLGYGMENKSGASRKYKQQNNDSAFEDDEAPTRSGHEPGTDGGFEVGRGTEVPTRPREEIGNHLCELAK